MRKYPNRQPLDLRLVIREPELVEWLREGAMREHRTIHQEVIHRLVERMKEADAATTTV